MPPEPIASAETRGRPRLRRDDEILDAALLAFASHGYAGMSLRKLNSELGLSHGTISHRYGSKERLYYAAVDHGFVQSIYFAGPEGLNLEICCGSDIDERAWIDPEVVGLCELTPDEIAALKDPAPFLRPAEPLPQPPTDPARPQLHYPPGVYEVLSAMSDQQLWESASQPTPPVVLE